MESVSTAEARKYLADLLNRAAYGKERFVVTRHGKELVAIVPAEDLELLERLRQFASRCRRGGDKRCGYRFADQSIARPR